MRLYLAGSTARRYVYEGKGRWQARPPIAGNMVACVYRWGSLVKPPVADNRWVCVFGWLGRELWTIRWHVYQAGLTADHGQ